MLPVPAQCCPQQVSHLHAICSIAALAIYVQHFGAVYFLQSTSVSVLPMHYLHAVYILRVHISYISYIYVFVFSYRTTSGSINYSYLTRTIMYHPTHLRLISGINPHSPYHPHQRGREQPHLLLRYLIPTDINLYVHHVHVYV